MLLELQSPRIPLLTRSQCAQRRFHSYEQTLRQHIPSRGQMLTTMLLLLLLCTENPLTRSRHTTWGNLQNWHRRDLPCQAPVTSPQFLIIIFSKTTCHQGHHHPSPPIDQAARDEREFLTGLLLKVENQEEEEEDVLPTRVDPICLLFTAFPIGMWDCNISDGPNLRSNM